MDALLPQTSGRFRVLGPARAPLGLTGQLAVDAHTGGEVVVARLPLELAYRAALRAAEVRSGAPYAFGIDDALGGAYAIVAGSPANTLAVRIRTMVSFAELLEVARHLVTLASDNGDLVALADPWLVESCTTPDGRERFWGIAYPREIVAIVKARAIVRAPHDFTPREKVLESGVGLLSSRPDSCVFLVLWAAAVFALDPAERTDANIEALWTDPALCMTHDFFALLRGAGLSQRRARVLTTWARATLRHETWSSTDEVETALRGTWEAPGLDVCANPKGSWSDDGLSSGFDGKHAEVGAFVSDDDMQHWPFGAPEPDAAEPAASVGVEPAQPSFGERLMGWLGLGSRGKKNDA
jgi:hypothetical protein